VKNEDSSIARALEKLREICSRQEKCPAEVRVLLKRWDINQEHHQEIIGKLISERFIDEHRYASAFVRDKTRFDHWGRIKIRYFLQQKGIAKSASDKAIGEIDQDEYRKMVGKELAKKRKSLKGSPRDIWAKLARYGSSRGYEMEIMHDFLGETTLED
jgi:regulatory protein